MSTNEFAAIETLDLAPIKMKLMHVESGEGWSSLRANAVEAEYRRFLHLMKKYPDSGASPSVDVDTFWHYHILDTMKYALDCETVFGYFLHHYPYVGIGASANDGDHAAGGERMRQIYDAEFGAGAAANDAYAYCSSPNKRFDVAGAAYAYCSSPNRPLQTGAAYAYCSSPNQPLAADAATAYCSSPNKRGEAANAHAYCSSPNKSAEGAYAYCSSPNKPGHGTYAYCSSPNQPRQAATATYAYCSSPNKPRAAGNDASAYCSSPNRQFEAGAATAYCSSPNKPGNAANEAFAYCSSPNKPSQAKADAASKALAHAA
ncbi:conserved hypothetical protein [Massilia sp. 9I]|nr:conserved hypothetical protein [Massilia sp. 9I]